MTKNCILALEENPESIYLEISSVLLRLAENVIKDPSNPKYRSLRLGNPTVANKLLPAVGAMECLFEMGFQEGEDSLVLPDNVSIENLKRIRDEMSARRSSYKNQTLQTPKSTGKIPEKEASSSTSCASGSTIQRQQPDKLQLTVEKPKRPFLQKVTHNFNRVLRYEDKDLQEKALAKIPLTELEIAAQKNMRRLQLAIKKGDSKETEIDVQELVLLELLNWFKNSFFSWVDTPNCRLCKGTTKFAGHSIGSIGEGGVERTEVFICNTCHEQTLFPRYNDPEKLLQTRRGRCGEWANCFTLLCRACGWDARYIEDETDHVWTEVYSGTQKRWIHYDPCENVCGSPLMYEAGWSKKLSYVMAYSKDEVQDVTWRYTSKHQEVMSRRTLCREEDLVTTIMNLRQERQKNMSQAKRHYLSKRLIVELVEFLTPRQPTEAEKKGRSSGSLAWRQGRGETKEVFEHYTWKPTKAEIAAGKMHIKYSTSKNKYIREIGKEEQHSWDKGVFEANSIFRKEEKDWKMAYLTRTEGSTEGSISWKFDLSGTGVVVDNVRLSFCTQLYETGQVNLEICGPDTCVLVPAKKNVFETDAFQGSTQLEVTAKLKGGSGDNSWQHAQLFRQEMSNDKDYPFDIIIKLRKV